MSNLITFPSSDAKYTNIRVNLDNEHWYQQIPKWVEISHQIKVTILYRVSIKSFPDYKHLLQENYVK